MKQLIQLPIPWNQRPTLPNYWNYSRTLTTLSQWIIEKSINLLPIKLVSTSTLKISKIIIPRSPSYINNRGKTRFSTFFSAKISTPPCFVSLIFDHCSSAHDQFIERKNQHERDVCFRYCTRYLLPEKKLQNTLGTKLDHHRVIIL